MISEVKAKVRVLWEYAEECHPGVRGPGGISQEEVGLTLSLEGCVKWTGVGPLENAEIFSRNKSSRCDALELGKSVANLNDYKISGLKYHY